MKTGKEYNRYGQTGLRPEDFTGPCEPCSTVCGEEIADLLSKFNFFTLGTGETGEFLSIPSDSFKDFSTAGNYELEDVHVAISKRETFLGDIRIDFEDKGQRGVVDSSSIALGVSESGVNMTFAKYSRTLVYQHFNGAFSYNEEPGEDGTTAECKCFRKWIKHYHKRVDSERLIELSGCNECIDDNAERSIRLVKTDSINTIGDFMNPGMIQTSGIIEENMVNTSTTIETIDVFAVIDHFNVFPVCGGLEVDQSGPFEFDYIKEKEDDDDVEERFKGEGFYIFARSDCKASRVKFNVASHSQHPHFVGSSADSRFAQNFRNSKGRFFDNDSYSRSLGIKRESRLTQVGRIYHVKIHNAAWGDLIINQIPASDAGGPDYWTTEHPLLRCPPSDLVDTGTGIGFPEDEEEFDGSLKCKWCQPRGDDEDSPGEEGSVEVPTSTGLLTLPFIENGGDFSKFCDGDGSSRVRKYSGDFCEEQKKYIFPDEESALESLLERLREKETIIGCTTRPAKRADSIGETVLDPDGNPVNRDDEGGGFGKSGFGHLNGKCPNAIRSIECGEGYLTPFSRLNKLDENNEPIFENPEDSESEDNESEDSESESTGSEDDEELVAKFGSWSQAYIHDLRRGRAAIRYSGDEEPEDDPNPENCSEQDRQLDGSGLLAKCMPKVDGYVKLNSEPIYESEEGEGESEEHDVFLEYMLKDRNEEQQDRYRIIEPNKDDRFNLSNVTYLVNQSTESDPLLRIRNLPAGGMYGDGGEQVDSSGSGDLQKGGACAIESVCNWSDTDIYTELQTQQGGSDNTTENPDQIVGITYYEINLDDFQSQIAGDSRLDIDEDMGILILPEQIYQRTFDVILEQVAFDYNLGGFESTDVPDITMDWIESGTTGQIDLSVIEYIYRANKAIYFYSNDPFLAVAEGENVGSGVGLVDASSCGPPTRTIGWGQTEVDTGCYDIYENSSLGGGGMGWPPVRTLGLSPSKYTLSAISIFGEQDPTRGLETCNEQAFTFFIGESPPPFDTGQRVHDCGLIVDEVYLFPGASNTPKNIKRGTQDLEFENPLVKKCLYDEDGNITDAVPEGMICTEESIEEGEEEIETLCGKKGFVYIVHRKNAKPIAFAPRNPTDGGNSERVGINCKTCFEEFPEPEDKYFYECSTQITYPFSSEEISTEAFASFEPDLATEISGSNYCSIQYPLDTSFVIDPFTGNRHGCQMCPDYVAECEYNFAGDLKTCKMRCGSPQEDIIEFPYCDKMGDQAIYVGAELPCCDNCYSSQDEGDEDGEDPGDPGDPGGMDDPAGMAMWGGGGDLDTCKKQSYACGVGVSPHQSGYWWWRNAGNRVSLDHHLIEDGVSGDVFGGDGGCGACFSDPKQFMEKRCCHRGVECDYYAIDITGGSEVIVPGVVKDFEELPLEIKLY